MSRRGWAVLGAVLITLIVYAPILYALFRRVMLRLAPPLVSLSNKKRPPPPDDLLGLPSLASVVDFIIYYRWVVLLWSILPATWLGLELFYKLRRHQRDKLGLCLECGYRLESHRGRCPGCGVRVGPGLSSRRYAL